MSRLNKIFLLLKNLKKIRFSVDNKKITIFDGASFPDLQYIIEDYDYFILEDRLDRINIIYITPSIIFYFFVYLFLIFKEYSVKVIYTIALIKSLKTKVVITSIDNSINFFLCAKVLNKEIFFIAIQNANRFGFRDIDFDTFYVKNYKKLFYIPNYVCYGQHEIDGATEQKLKIEKFHKYGSIRMSNAIHYIQKNNIKLNKKFDICFISEPIGYLDNKFKNNFIAKAAIDLLKFTIKFSIQNNFKFVFASKRLENTDAYKLEIDFYKSHLSSQEFQFLISNINKKKDYHSSYFALLQSTVAIGFQSTLLLDKIGLNEKILSCNFSGFKLLDFPITGICSLNTHDYEDFSTRVKLILSLKNDEYFKKLNQNPDYVNALDKKESLIKKTRKIIEKNL